MDKAELLHKAIDWLDYIESTTEHLDGFKNSPPPFYTLFCKMEEHTKEVHYKTRHLERCIRIYNRIINQLKIK